LQKLAGITTISGVNATTKVRLSFADGLRGIAALWVVLFHLAEGQHIENVKKIIPIFAYNIFFDWGHLGVAIFFVLSGFVMALNAQKIKFDSTNAFRFVIRRLKRLAPPYYFAIAFTLILLFIKSKALHLSIDPPSIGNVVQHIFFVQDFFGTPQINIVFWTLCVEIQFYIVFAVLLWFADLMEKRFDILFARNLVIMAACFVALLWPLKIMSTVFWQGGFIGFWYSFLAGVMVCWAWLNKGMLLNASIAYCLTLLVIGLAYRESFVIVAALTANLIMFTGIKQKMHRWLNWPILQWLGLISYSLYLLHNPITGASMNVSRRLLPSGLYADICSAFVAILVCLVAAYMSYLIFERPSVKWSQSVVLKK
jgi:peptidoglycan/LPS O-acetylase OafA/YrhL